MATKLPPIPPLYLWGGLGIAAALFLLTRKGVAEALAKGTVSAVGQAVTGAAVGTVKGIGEAVGIPDTDADQCTIDLANGDYWAASKSCPAPRWANVAILRNTDFEAEKLKFIRSGY